MDPNATPHAPSPDEIYLSAPRAGADAPLAPPTSPDYSRIKPAEKKTWTIVLGILGILYSIYAGLTSLAGFMMLFVSDAFQASNAASGTNLDMRDYMMVTGADYLASGVIGILLFVGAIALLTRRSWSGRCWIIWASLKVVIVLVSSVFAALAFQAVMQSATAQAGATGGGTPVPPRAMGIFAIFPALFGAVFGLLWPTFVLIWFLRPAIRAQIRSWAGPKPG